MPWVAWFGGFAFTAVLGTLAYIALTEGAVSTAGKTGIHYFEGPAAVRLAFFFFAVILAWWGWMAQASRFKNLIRLSLAILWLAAALAWYLLH